MKQERLIMQEASARATGHETQSLAELFAGTRLASAGGEKMPAVKIVHFDETQAPTSSKTVPLSAFAGE